MPESLAAALERDSRHGVQGTVVPQRKEYVRWIEAAKRDETRQRRVQQALEMLRAGKDGKLSRAHEPPTRRQA